MWCDKASLLPRLSIIDGRRSDEDPGTRSAACWSSFCLAALSWSPPNYWLTAYRAAMTTLLYPPRTPRPSSAAGTLDISWKVKLNCFAEENSECFIDKSSHKQLPLKGNLSYIWTWLVFQNIDRVRAFLWPRCEHLCCRFAECKLIEAKTVLCTSICLRLLDNCWGTVSKWLEGVTLALGTKTNC